MQVTFVSVLKIHKQYFLLYNEIGEPRLAYYRYL